MKASKLTGKTIRKVHQVYNAKDRTAQRPGFWDLIAIEFIDGTTLRFMVVETEGDYGLEGVYPAAAIGTAGEDAYNGVGLKDGAR